MKVFNLKRTRIYPIGFFAIMALFTLSSCVESFEVAIPNRKSLVIRSLLTNEMKRHEVFLSRAYRFDDGSIVLEDGAEVRVIDNNQNEYSFNEEEGRYVSKVAFAAQPGVGYTLVVNTKDGKTYRSSPEKFEEAAVISNVLAERGPNSFGEDGVLISVNVKDISGNSQFFRYEYEETYKIIAPQYFDLDFKLENYDPCANPDTYDFEVVPREEQQKICYASQYSNEIIQINTSNMVQNNIEKYKLRFIGADNYILSHRYSILVKQYVQSAKAFAYYETLNDFSSSESVFTDIQPGFLSGNIVSESNSTEKVLGLFEVSSVSTKRLFFDYTDFFPDEQLPDYPFSCNTTIRPPLEQPQFCNGSSFPHCERKSFYVYVNEGSIAYWRKTENTGCGGGPYVVVSRGCGDCTLLGSNKVPDFWIE